MAVWSVVGLMASSLSSALAVWEDGRTPLLGVLALLCLGAGVGLLRYGRVLHRYFDPAPTRDTEAIAGA